MNRIGALVLAGLVLTLPLGSVADEARRRHLAELVERGAGSGGASLLAEAQSGAALKLSPGSTQLSIPEWLKRVDLSVQFGSEKPRYYIETVQPLYQSRDLTHTFFVQPRISAIDEDLTANLGLGYRQLFFEQQLLAGINTFYDYTERHTHYRLGVGLELLSHYLELRTNGYFPLSGRRTVGEDANREVFERALTGMDAELGGPVPYLPFLKLFGSYAYYDYTKDIDSHIGKFRAELKLARFLRLDVETWNDNKAPWQYRVGLVFTLDLERPSESFSKPSAEAYPHKDMRHMTLHRVVREHEIKVERFAKTKGAATGEVTIAVRRGT